MEVSRVVVLDSSITERRVHLDGQGRFTSVVARTRRPPMSNKR
jgi:hypothetical protein